MKCLLFILATVLLAACSPSEGVIQTAIAETMEAAPTETPIPATETVAPTFTAPAPTASATPSTCIGQDPGYFDAIESILERWDDARSVAESTSRIALSGPIQLLQSIKQETNALDRPECAEKFHTVLQGHMDSTIDGFLEFAGDDPEEFVERTFIVAGIREAALVDHLKVLSGEEEELPNKADYLVFAPRSLVSVDYYEHDELEITSKQSPWIHSFVMIPGENMRLTAISESTIIDYIECHIFLDGLLVAIGTGEGEVTCEAEADLVP